MRSYLTTLALTLLLSGAAPAGDRPNILFCIADDWGWPHAGAYGAGGWIETPTFDRIAAEGVLFENAFTSNPKCCPCRASIAAGRNTWQMREAVNHIVQWPKEFLSYVDLLEEAGYHVGLTGKGWGPGDWKKSGRKYNPAGPGYEKFKTKPEHRGISSKDYARNFIEDFLAARPSDDTPFCFWLGTHEPHRFYDLNSGLRTGKDPAKVELPGYYPEDRKIRADFLDYALEVEHFDTHVGRCLEHLEKIGELDNTIVVMTSDHGKPSPRIKGQIYEHAFHLPLAVRWGSRAPGGRKVMDFINVRDFAPTFLEAAGLPPHEQFTGRSFIDLLESSDSGWIDPESRNVMLVGKERHDLGRPHDWGYPVRAIRTPDFLYIRNYEPDRWPAGDPETGYRNCDHSPIKDILTNSFDHWYSLSFGKRPARELYRISGDPDCLENLAKDPGYADTVKNLETRMKAMLREEGDPRELGEAAWFDTIEYTGSRKHAFDVWERGQDLLRKPVSGDHPGEIPSIDGAWWPVAGNPDLGELTGEEQQPVDFGLWQAADGTWQLWSCIRKTKEEGKTRLFHRWEGKQLTDPDWQAMGVAQRAAPELGETAGGMQAPHVVTIDGRYHLFYGDWQSICLAASDDGKRFVRQPLHGISGRFGEGPQANARDIMMIEIDGLWHGYYTAHPGRIGRVLCRTTEDFVHWSEPVTVRMGGKAGHDFWSHECPHVVRRGDWFYLFTTQRYLGNPETSVYRSRDPLAFGIEDDSTLITTLPVAAPEIVFHQGETYIAALNPDLDGIRIARLKWTEK